MIKPRRMSDKIANELNLSFGKVERLSDILKLHSSTKYPFAQFTILFFIVFGLFIGLNCSKNKDPEIYDLVAPDSLQKGSPDSLHMYIRVRDPQGLGNIDSVFYTVIKPDGTSNGIPLSSHDDGREGDSIALDGVYTFNLRSPAMSNQTGDYIFRFMAKDKDGHESNTLNKTITAYVWPNPVISRITVDQYDIARQHIFVAARVLNIPNQLTDSVWVEITFQDSARSIGAFLLNDDGAYGDSSAGDTRYSLDVISPDDYFSPGEYQIIFKAIDSDGLQAIPVDAIISVEPPSRITMRYR
jgi:hypothetical protein